MNGEILKAYESLVPSDQLVIDAMIVSLFKKDKRIHDMTQKVMKLVDRARKLGLITTHCDGGETE